ncbi:MAG: RNA polymerase sigma factor [Actinomycetota bacterium]|nr:RNA polymerase sigma factor [Actinomycetota bacterium]
MESQLSDAEVVRESVERPALFAVLYERHRLALVRYALRRVGGELAEDVTAEVFVRAFRARATYRPEHETALPWLLGIATNLIADHRRRERRRLKALQRLSADAPEALGHADPALSQELIRTLRRLPAADRDALLLVVWGELSYEETASALGVPVGTVRSRIARARRRLSVAIGGQTKSTEAAVNGEAHA